MRIRLDFNKKYRQQAVFEYILNYTKIILSYPVRIFARACDSCTDNCKDPCGMT